SYRCECESGYVLADDAHNCKEGGCHLQLHDPDGEITSPNFPFDYPKGKTCNWHFVTTPGHRLLLAFEEFALEEHNMCKYDHVEVFDGGDAQAPSLGFLVEPTLPHDGHRRKCSTAWIQSFLFICLWWRVKGGGNGGVHLLACSCEWRILADAGRGVELRFAQFDLEKEASCDFDFVEVFDGHDRSDDHKLGHFCGDQVIVLYDMNLKSLILGGYLPKKSI
uniref:CUB domain-containing protein n=1 Tax=Parascaris equorum TaxID=6256 RepID=A0A914RSC5_PAREQ